MKQCSSLRLHSLTAIGCLRSVQSARIEDRILVEVAKPELTDSAVASGKAAGLPHVVLTVR
jgi:hypothetical protein